MYILLCTIYFITSLSIKRLQKNATWLFSLSFKMRLIFWNLTNKNVGKFLIIYIPIWRPMLAYYWNYNSDFSDIVIDKNSCVHSAVLLL